MIQVSSKVVYANQWLSLREDRIQLPDGSPGIYTVVDKPVAALVIPYENDGFHLIEQFRYPIGRRSWEFPQGTWPHGGDPGEELARAELSEETGLRAESLEKIGRIALAPGLTSQESDVFVATGLTQGALALEHTEQGMEQRWFRREEFEAMIRNGEILDNTTLAAYSLFLVRKT